MHCKRYQRLHIRLSLENRQQLLTLIKNMLLHEHLIHRELTRRRQYLPRRCLPPLTPQIHRPHRPATLPLRRIPLLHLLSSPRNLHEQFGVLTLHPKQLENQQLLLQFHGRPLKDNLEELGDELEDGSLDLADINADVLLLGFGDFVGLFAGVGVEVDHFADEDG
jgi:hypothetical protein